MPAGAGQTVAGDLGRLFKDLIWLSGPTLHEAQRRVAHAWVAVTEDSWRRALQVGVLANTLKPHTPNPFIWLRTSPGSPQPMQSVQSGACCASWVAALASQESTAPV